MKRDQNGLRYLPWLVRDAALWPFRWFVFALAILSVVVSRFAANMHLPAPGHGGFTGSQAIPTSIPQMVQLGVWNTCLTVAILMTIGGIVGTDLDRGYYRSLFSKPISPLWYYLQRWLVGAVVVLLCPLALGVGLLVAVGGSTGVTWNLIAQIALAYFLVGSATLMLSIFSSKGWLLVFLMSFIQGILGGLVRMGSKTVPSWVVGLHQLLPPFHLLQPGLPVPGGGDLRLLLGYSAGMFALAIFMLRTQPLASGISS